METFEITVGLAGVVRTQARRLLGGESRDATRFVDQALGARTAEAVPAQSY